nr:unnamed protein product [Callosobruchus analis]
MAMFRQLLNKVKSSLKSGAGRNDIFKPSWFAYETMANFLLPVYSARDTINRGKLVDLQLLSLLKALF